jgi:hypothetical protein
MATTRRAGLDLALELLHPQLALNPALLVPYLALLVTGIGSAVEQRLRRSLRLRQKLSQPR